MGHRVTEINKVKEEIVRQLCSGKGDAIVTSINTQGYLNEQVKVKVKTKSRECQIQL